MIRQHVERLGERHPPVDLGSADYSLADPAAVRARFAEVLEYMTRVEMEVERNVLELAVLLPGVSETDRLFYADVWGPQEAHHGILLDTLGQRLGMPPAEPDLVAMAPRVRVLGALAHLPVVHEVIRLLYYLTGAATEKAAMMAYQAISDGLQDMGELAVKKTVVDAIKVQEPGHFAFYHLSAVEMVQSNVLAPWQLHLARFLRSRTFSLVGAATPEQRAGFGGVLVNLRLETDRERNVRDIVRVETQLLADGTKASPCRRTRSGPSVTPPTATAKVVPARCRPPEREPDRAPRTRPRGCCRGRAVEQGAREGSYGRRTHNSAGPKDRRCWKS